MRFNLHSIFLPLTSGFAFVNYLSRLSKWRSENKSHAHNDFFSSEFDYSRRYKMYDFIEEQEIKNGEIDYIEFGVSRGESLKHWLKIHNNPASRFFGFDTFTGLPEDWGGFKRGDMIAKVPELNDSRCKFVAGLFQDTLPSMMKEFNKQTRKIVHLDADLYSSTYYVLNTLAPVLNKNDILIFDEFSVPMHEFKAFTEFVSSYYIKYQVIASANNYFHLAVKII
jgi:O-methyltransferase